MASLYFIKTINVGSGRIEVHIASAGSSYKDVQHYASAFSEVDAGNGVWTISKGDLVFVKTRVPGSGRIEIHIAAANDDYRSFALHKATAFDLSDAGNGAWLVYEHDLYFVKLWNTGVGKIQVQVATKESDYQKVKQYTTGFDLTDAGNGTWVIGEYGDLYFIKVQNTDSGHIEVHRASASSGYRELNMHDVSWFSEGDAGNGTWWINGSSLYFVKVRNDESKHIEVHASYAKDGYKAVDHEVSWFSPSDAGNGTWTID